MGVGRTGIWGGLTNIGQVSGYQRSAFTEPTDVSGFLTLSFIFPSFPSIFPSFSLHFPFISLHFLSDLQAAYLPPFS